MRGYLASEERNAKLKDESVNGANNVPKLRGTDPGHVLRTSAWYNLVHKYFCARSTSYTQTNRPVDLGKNLGKDLRELRPSDRQSLGISTLLVSKLSRSQFSQSTNLRSP